MRALFFTWFEWSGGGKYVAPLDTILFSPIDTIFLLFPLLLEGGRFIALSQGLRSVIWDGKRFGWGGGEGVEREDVSEREVKMAKHMKARERIKETRLNINTA